MNVEAGFCDDTGKVGTFCKDKTTKVRCVQECKTKDGKRKCEFEKASETTCTNGCDQTRSTYAVCKAEPCVSKTAGTSSMPNTTFCDNVVNYKIEKDANENGGKYSDNAMSHYVSLTSIFNFNSFPNGTGTTDKLSNATACFASLKAFKCRSAFRQCKSDTVAGGYSYDDCAAKCAESYYCIKATIAKSNGKIVEPNPFDFDANIHANAKDACLMMCGSAAGLTTSVAVIVAAIAMMVFFA
eukprot:CAMPEP_0117419284 /NCGR_PEP_ID=MMETSP0758-20121206/880_1 /TAXON_ID=63605 /ORGANISM="Percolomonas cosmopolitus, Strain AE-1 (ATCC 50343)" /LENGTH=240 /DNA_ID=CAMNT_0005200263 /DNA_START=65 /DNA_END=787 /DNA_ORIENTATION=+